MFEKFLSANLDSFRQRYEGTYGFYRDENKKRLLCQLTAIGNSRCVFVDAQGVEYQLNPDTNKDIGFEFLPPKSSWYNTSEGAVWTQRNAQRQFQRGVTGRNLSIKLLHKGRYYDRDVDFKSLSEIYETAKSPKEAMAILEKGKSWAISKQFALDPISKTVHLMHSNVGTYAQEGKKFIVKLMEPQLWRTELTDALNAVECTTEILKND